jgi:transcriptional regulator with XRE-family HTH domain
MCGGRGVLAITEAPPLAVTAQRLRGAIDAKGFTQTELANAIGRSQAAVSHWINAKREPGRHDLFALASVLDVGVAWLMGASDALDEKRTSTDGA